jgi:hypothetical protein
MAAECLAALFAPTMNVSPSNIVSTLTGNCAPLSRVARPLASQLRASSKRWYAARYVRRRNLVTPVPVERETMERSMDTQQERPWPAIDLAELRFGIEFGSSAEELADFLQRDVEDVKQKWAAEVQRSAAKI